MNNYLNNLIKKINIVKVIKKYVKLERCGNSYRGFSPFQKENNPSFMVSPKKNIWKDFSSGKGGNIVKFIMYMLNYNYNEAVRFLINKYYYNKKNFKIDKINNKSNKLLYTVNKILIKINNLYKKFLANNKYVLKYLLDRKLKKNTINNFKLGYSPTNISISFFLKKNKIKYNNRILKNLGIFTIINKKFYYLFKNRIMFPIQDINGNIIGFGGRTLDLYAKKNKYINSANNIVFNKSRILYGLFQNKEEIIKNDLCYIVEGYMDLLSLYNKNINNVVASLGTNISTYQILLIKKYTNNIVLLYDGDDSGIYGSLKNINIFLINNINLRLFLFPKNNDPSSFINKKFNSNKTKDYFLKNSLDFIDYYIKIFKNKFDNLFFKFNILNQILNNVICIKNDILKEFYLEKIAKKFKISTQYVHNAINEIGKQNIKKTGNIQDSSREEFEKEKYKEYKNKFEKEKEKKYKVNIKKKIKYYMCNIISLIKKIYNLKKYKLVYRSKVGDKYITSYNILFFIFNLLHKYKIIFFKKPERLIKKIKNTIVRYKNYKYKKEKKINKYIKIKLIIKENLLKYKYYLLLKKINICLKSNIINIKKFYYLIKEKKKILKKIYYL